MTPSEAEAILEAHGVRPTAVRSLIYRTLALRRDTFALADLEDDLPTADRSTLFRTLELLTASGLLHATDDGSGSRKYCVCLHPSEPHPMHVHFYCESCGHTYCLDSVTLPVVELPEGFTAKGATHVVRGRCPACSR